MYPTVATLLDPLGLAIEHGRPVMLDFNEAGSGYIHHTRIPVALVGYARVSMPFARGRFPDLSFIRLIHARPNMDESEVLALAACCGIEVKPPFWGNPEPFAAHLWDVIERYDLWPFFVRVERAYGSGDHYRMRPHGFDWASVDEPEIPGALDQWRKSYRALPTEKQLLVTTILHLYLTRNDNIWMVRVPKKWHAAEGLEILEKTGCLADWARLYALYPGW